MPLLPLILLKHEHELVQLILQGVHSSSHDIWLCFGVGACISIMVSGVVHISVFWSNHYIDCYAFGLGFGCEFSM